MNGTGFSATDLNELQRQLVAWRGLQHGRARLPEAVWAAAAALAHTQGISWVARTLGLDYYKLRRRCAARGSSPPPGDGLSTFVELQLREGARESSRSFRVELSSAHGTRMTIDLGGDVAAVVSLAEAFWRRIP